MIGQISEEQLYEDLSVILSLIKKTFKSLLSKTAIEIIAKDLQRQEAIISHKCSLLVSKYKKIFIKGAQSLSIVDRFKIRVKEILQQISVCIPKQKLQLIIISKKIQLIISKPSKQESSSDGIISILQLLSNCHSKTSHCLKIKPEQKINKQNKMTKSILIQNKEENIQDYLNEQKRPKQTDLDLLMKNIGIYSVLSLDQQYYRGQYFDSKNSDGQIVFSEIFSRNRVVKSSIADYQKSYSKFSVRNSVSSPRKKESKPICWEIVSPNEESNLLYSERKKAQSRSSKLERTASSRTNQTISYNSIQNFASAGIESFRSQFESKMLKNKGKQTIKLKETIIGIPQGMKSMSGKAQKDINIKRLNFFKKSQDHLKFRYKYSQNKSFYTINLHRNQTINHQTLNCLLSN